MLYFAYGSNMLTVRLRERVPSAVPLGCGSLEGWDVAFHKRGRDGTAKCTLVTSNVTAHGVLFEIDPLDLGALDRAEGLGSGYERPEVSVEVQGLSLVAMTYVAQPEWTDDGVVPYDWYLALVVAGAREHGLHAEWVERLASTPTRPSDPAQAAPFWELIRRGSPP